MSLLGLAQWLADTPWSVALHESLYGYPIVESIHVWALCLFVGLTVVLDLRLTIDHLPVACVDLRPTIFRQLPELPLRAARHARDALARSA